MLRRTVQYIISTTKYFFDTFGHFTGKYIGKKYISGVITIYIISSITYCGLQITLSLFNVYNMGVVEWTMNLWPNNINTIVNTFIPLKIFSSLFLLCLIKFLPLWITENQKTYFGKVSEKTRKLGGKISNKTFKKKVGSKWVKKLKLK